MKWLGDSIPIPVVNTIPKHYSSWVYREFTDSFIIESDFVLVWGIFLLASVVSHAEKAIEQKTQKIIGYSSVYLVYVNYRADT